MQAKKLTGNKDYAAPQQALKDGYGWGDEEYNGALVESQLHWLEGTGQEGYSDLMTRMSIRKSHGAWLWRSWMWFQNFWAG